ncbi:MAG: HIT family protein [Acidimicrobiia bacterium]
MTTLFTRIIEGDIPGTFVWRDPECVAFMSINPIRWGHVLVVPRTEVDHWLECPRELFEHLVDVSRTIGAAQKQVFRPDRIGLIVAGFEVPHLHIHVVPADGPADIDFANAAQSVDPADLEDAAASIRYVLRSQGLEQVSD